MTTSRQTARATSQHDQPAAVSRRAIGRWGTTARLMVGLLLVGDVAYGHWARGFHLAAWTLGLIGFPAAMLVAQSLRARPRPPLRATGPAGLALNAAVFLALYLTPWYAPAASVTIDAALVFYGASMLIAAARGYAGSEVLAIPNWILRRDDQVGCLIFSPPRPPRTVPPVLIDGHGCHPIRPSSLDPVPGYGGHTREHLDNGRRQARRSQPPRRCGTTSSAGSCPRPSARLLATATIQSRQ
jgi:hypothetical protein